MADFFSARKLYPLYIVPFIIGLIGFIFIESQWVYVFFITSIGITNGFGATVKNAVLAELYGTKIVGSVRSLFITVMVFITAIGPVAFGFFLDKDYSFIFLSIASAICFALLMVNAMRIYLLK